MVCRVGGVACRWRCAVWRGVVWCGAVKCDAVWRVLYVVPVFVGETADSPRRSLHVTGLYLIFLSLLFFCCFLLSSLCLLLFYFGISSFLARRPTTLRIHGQRRQSRGSWAGQASTEGVIMILFDVGEGQLIRPGELQKTNRTTHRWEG